jgi:hypothetical protein
MLTVKQAAPFHVILITMVTLVLVNLVAAQVLLRVLYSTSSWQLGTPTLIATAVVAAFGVVATVRGWRTYLRSLPPRRSR